MTGNDCPDCGHAQTNPHWAGSTPWCHDCAMRMLAHGYRTSGVDHLTACAGRALHQELGRYYPRTAEECKERIRYWIGRLNVQEVV